MSREDSELRKISEEVKSNYAYALKGKVRSPVSVMLLYVGQKRKTELKESVLFFIHTILDDGWNV